MGDRQEGREHGPNVVFAEYKKDSIKEKINFQLSKKYEENYLFGEGNAGILIANKIASLNLIKK